MARRQHVRGANRSIGKIPTDRLALVHVLLDRGGGIYYENLNTGGQIIIIELHAASNRKTVARGRTGIFHENDPPSFIAGGQVGGDRNGRRKKVVGGSIDERQKGEVSSEN